MNPVLRRSVTRAAVIALIVWLGVSVEVLLSNVVFPSTSDDDAVSVLISYLCIFAAMLLSGLLAARAGSGPKGQALAGLLTGATIGLLTMATFAVVDNVWLDIVSQQQAKIDGFARSGAGSMRDFINRGLITGAVFLTLALGFIGALLGLLGGLFGRRAPSGQVEA